MPLISIITTVYNNEKYLENAVNSVICQSYRDIEYIIIDDGSTDNTLQVAKNIAKKDSRVKVFSQKNQWIYAGVNRGIKEAKGEYIYIINSDDKMFDESLEYMANIVNQYKPDVIWTKIIGNICDENQKVIKRDIYNFESTVQMDDYLDSKHENQVHWTELVRKSLAWNQANLYKRELMLKHPFRNDVYGGDVLFNISIADDINTSYIMAKPVYEFLQYNSKKMNTSIGKYYGYEHNMFNDFYIEQRNVYDKWDTTIASDYEFIEDRRIKNLTYEIGTYRCENCKLTIENKIKKIMTDLDDGVVYECAKKQNRIEEYESRILSGLRQLFIKEIPSEDSEYRFMYDMIESLLRYEKDSADYEKIKEAVNHPLNRYHVGQIFYEKIKGEEKNV